MATMTKEPSLEPKQNFTIVIKKDTRYLLGIVAAMEGKTPSEFMAELADAVVATALTPEQRRGYLKRRQLAAQETLKKAQRLRSGDDNVEDSAA